jgi:hypothetical protein
MNIASTRLTKYTEDVDEAEDKALVYTKETVQGTYTAEEDIREDKEIKDSDKRSAMFVIN